MARRYVDEAANSLDVALENARDEDAILVVLRGCATSEKWAKLLQEILMLMVDIGDAIRRSDLFLAVCDGKGLEEFAMRLGKNGKKQRRRDGGERRVYILDVRILNKKQTCSYMNQTSQPPT